MAMAVEFKTLPQFQTKAIADRTVTGVFCVHGNRDDGRDRSHNGALADYGQGGRIRVRHLWNHGGGWLDRGQTPPIAAIKAIRELSREQLPEAVVKFAPDATGGVEVEREYLDTPRGNEILAGIKAGAIDEMSYAYDVLKATYTSTSQPCLRRLRSSLSAWLTSSACARRIAAPCPLSISTASRCFARSLRQCRPAYRRC
jgi:hypothetical protein